MIVVYSIITALICIVYIAFRIKNIQNEIEKTGKLKNKGFIEFLAKKYILEDIEKQKTLYDTGWQKKPLKTQNMKKKTKNLTNK